MNAFEAGQAFGARIIALWGDNQGSSRRRAFWSGVYYAIWKEAKRTNPPHRPSTPVTKLMLEKHRQVISAKTEVAELRDQIEKMEGAA